MTNALVELCVTASGAVYVDNTRITDRSTKPWGGSKTLYEAIVPHNEIVSVLIDKGYKRLLSKIDTEPYLTQAKAALENLA